MASLLRVGFFLSDLSFFIPHSHTFYYTQHSLVMETINNLVQKVVGSTTASTTTKPASEQTILVTGASGFVAAHVLTSFLSAGYKVRGTVRSESTAEKVKQTHAQYASQLTFAIVEDIRAPNAFDDAVKGVDGVIHTASPFQFDVSDNEKELLLPAINGTKSILDAVAKHASQVRRVVVTSSFAAIIDMGKADPKGYVYSEKDWNPCSYEDAKNGPGPVAYCASKAFAERAAFDFVEERKPAFDVATICPPMVYGPVDHAVSDLSKLNTSSADIYRFISGSATEIGSTDFPLFVDVRDVARAHLKAYEVPEAGGQRFAVTGGKFFYQDVCEILRAEFPELKDKVPDPASQSERPETFTLSNEKARKVLGIEFRDLKECIVDTAKSLIKLEKEQQK